MDGLKNPTGWTGLRCRHGRIPSYFAQPPTIHDPIQMCEFTTIRHGFWEMFIVTSCLFFWGMGFRHHWHSEARRSTCSTSPICSAKPSEEYKYVRDRQELGGGFVWEDDIPNRCLSIPAGGLWVVTDRLWNCPGARVSLRGWKRSWRLQIHILLIISHGIPWVFMRFHGNFRWI